MNSLRIELLSKLSLSLLTSLIIFILLLIWVGLGLGFESGVRSVCSKSYNVKSLRKGYMIIDEYEGRNKRDK